MTTTIAAIRTHKWDEATEALANRLRPVFGDNLVVVFHNRPADVTPPIPVVDINEDSVKAMALDPVSDWGWRCGDYFLYALRKARPEADFYWLIEPDVFFTGDIEDFFARTEGRTEDLLGTRIEKQDSGHRFAKGMPGIKHWRAIFALVRFSGRALDILLAQRQAYAKLGFNRFYANDETFCFSTAKADPRLTMASLSEIMPDWVRHAQVATDPDMLLDLVIDRQDRGIYHPVRTRDNFIASLADRIANTGFLSAMRPSLARLTPENEAEVLRQAGRKILADLHEVRFGKD